MVADSPQSILWPLGLALSLAIHAVTAVTLTEAGKHHTSPASAPVKIRVVEKKPVEEPKKTEPTPPPKPPEPKPKPKPKPQKKIVNDRPKPQPPNAAPPPPVQGFSQAAMDGKGTVAVPLGNTLMAEDRGQRLKSEPAPIAGDLAADAQLIASSVKIPQYTDAALDANLEGPAIVDVYVDETGRVTQAEVRKKVGFGMDQRLIDASMAARFKPRRNKIGATEAGWSEIRFSLQLP